MTRVMRRLLLSGFALAAVGVAVAMASTPTSTGSARSDQAAVVAYRAGPLQRLISQVGSLVVYQIKPALADVNTGKLPPQRFTYQAAGWKANIALAQRQFDACAPPGPVRAAAVLYDQALKQYQQAMQAFGSAASVPRAHRVAAMHSAAQLANAADVVWNRADADLDQVLHGYGVDTKKPVMPSTALTC